jgi:hypothetical protein
MTMAADLPQQGQVVQVRQRRFVVTAIHQSQLPPDLLHPPTLPPQQLMMLRSVENDALGAELQVTWEVEPGAQLIDQAALPGPSGVDASERRFPVAMLFLMATHLAR